MKDFQFYNRVDTKVLLIFEDYKRGENQRWNGKSI